MAIKNLSNKTIPKYVYEYEEFRILKVNSNLFYVVDYDGDFVPVEHSTLKEAKKTLAKFYDEDLEEG